MGVDALWDGCSSRAETDDQDSAGVDASEQSTAAKDRRAYERCRMCRTVRVTEITAEGEHGVTWNCQAVDLSRGGMGLRSRRMVYVGTGLIVEVTDGQGLVHRVLYGIVRQTRYAPGEGYAIGLQFEKLPDSLRR